jgi:molybdenum storage protein
MSNMIPSSNAGRRYGATEGERIHRSIEDGRDVGREAPPVAVVLLFPSLARLPPVLRPARVRQDAAGTGGRVAEAISLQGIVAPEIAASLLTGSLSDEDILRATNDTPDLALLPDAQVIKIGGQSLIDRGRKALFPLVDEIGILLADHQIIIGTGAGTRARHVYSLGLDLGLPTGVLTVLGSAVAAQNARMVHWLLARHGIPFINFEEFGALPHYLAERHAVVFPGMVPYNLWERAPEIGRIPPHRTDTGCYLVSEVWGARSMVYVKDENGLYTADPKKDPNARFIPRISVRELIAMDLGDLVIERAVLEFMQRARHTKQIQIINGLIPGNLTRALNGEHVGTVVYLDETPSKSDANG